jgi:acetyl-CoA synthetase
MRFDASEIAKYDLSSLKILGTVGEPINPEAWRWYYTHVGRENCTIVDTYWQTETGAHIGCNLPGIVPMKPGKSSLSLPFSLFPSLSLSLSHALTFSLSLSLSLSLRLLYSPILRY